MLARWRAWLACVGAAFSLGAAAQALVEGDLPPFVVTPSSAVERMLALAQVGPDDTVLDLGSGDGRIVIEAVKRHGARGLGIEMNPRLVALSRTNAQREGVAGRARFEQGDALATELSQASVVTLYLGPELNEKLLPRILATMRPGSRVVSHDFALANWTPDRVERFQAPEKNNGRGGESVVMLWIVPVNAAGRWRGHVGEGAARRTLELSIAQQYQYVEAALHGNEGRVGLRASLAGDRITFEIPSNAHALTGKASARVDGDVMKGSWTAAGEAEAVAFEARRVSARPDVF
jgi:SAM-dependent methyltransferase